MRYYRIICGGPKSLLSRSEKSLESVAQYVSTTIGQVHTRMDDDDSIESFDNLFEPFGLEGGPEKKGDPQPAAPNHRARRARSVRKPPSRACRAAAPTTRRTATCERCGARLARTQMPVAPAADASHHSREACLDRARHGGAGSCPLGAPRQPFQRRRWLGLGDEFHHVHLVGDHSRSPRYINPGDVHLRADLVPVRGSRGRRRCHLLERHRWRPQGRDHLPLLPTGADHRRCSSRTSKTSAASSATPGCAASRCSSTTSRRPPSRNETTVAILSGLTSAACGPRADHPHHQRLPRPDLRRQRSLPRNGRRGRLLRKAHSGRLAPGG